MPTIRIAALRATAMMFATAMTFATAGHAATPAYHLPKPVVRTLPNGLTVGVFRDSRLPLVHLHLSVPAGSASEAPGEEGAANLVTQVMGVATASRDATTLNVDLDRMGGTISGQLGRDFATVTLNALSREMPAAMELLCDVSTRALFSDRDFDRARGTAMNDAARPSSPVALAEQKLWEAVFGAAPYGHAATGSPGSLDTLSLDSVRRFYLRHWRPNRSVLAVAGDVDPDSVFSAATRWFSDWSPGDAHGPQAPPPAPRRVTRIVDWPGAPAAQIAVGVPGPRSGDPDEIPIALAVELLNRGAASPADGRAEQRALGAGGMLWLTAEAPTDEAAAAAARLESRLLALGTGSIRAGALDTLRRAVQHTFPMRFETLEALAGQWSAVASVGSGYDDLASFPDRIAAMAPATVSAAAARWATASHVAVVAVGSDAELRAQFPAAEAAPAPRAAPVRAASDTSATADQLARGQELAKKAIQAHGGLSRLRGIKSSRFQSDAKLSLGAREVDTQLDETRVEPARMRVVSHVGPIGLLQVLDGEAAWSAPVDSLTGVRDLEADQAAALRQGFEADVPHLLLDAARPGARIAARGIVTANGQSLEKLEVWEASGARRILYVDPGTLLLAGAEQQESDPAGEMPSSVRWYRDYRAVNGIRLPFAEERWVGDKRVMRLVYTRITLNERFPDALFRKPQSTLPPTSR